MDRNGVIYPIKCKDCRTEYIRETGKKLRKRITEHKNAAEEDVTHYLPYFIEHSNSTVQ